LLKRFWLLFAQACTLCVAALFVVATLRPDLLSRYAGRTGPVVLTQESPAAAPPATSSPHALAAAARKATPAVVNIYTVKDVRPRNSLLDDNAFRQAFPDLAERLPQRKQNSLGSGVIVSPDGYVLTSNHVVAGADDIQLVLADGRVLKARIRGTDPESDLAVLKADATGLPSITFGSLEHVEVGDPVLAIGNAYGFGHTVTSGIVSALGRTSLGINRYEDFIQTDAPINPGNSGGALVDANGSLIGVNSAIYSQSGGSMGIGFAIPVSLARTVLEQIIQNGEVTRGWLGVEPQDLTADLARALALERVDGVLIRSVQRGGPADSAGIAPRDVVVEIAGKPTRDTPTLLARIAELKPGSTVKLVVVRANAPVDVDVTIGKRPKVQ
jgi:serine protease DegQ